MNTNTITSFDGEFRFLSNFYPAWILFEDHIYPTVEHAFQAAKTEDVNERIAIWNCHEPGAAKRAGRKLTLRPDWNNLKIDFMREFLQQKFSEEKLNIALAATAPRLLVEGNTWNDTFWGVCNGVGENHLGKLLMEVRDTICTNI